jgi:hypothetical protein
MTTISSQLISERYRSARDVLRRDVTAPAVLPDLDQAKQNIATIETIGAAGRGIAT